MNNEQKGEKGMTDNKKLFLVSFDSKYTEEMFRGLWFKSMNKIELTPSELELLKSLVMNFEDDLERGIEDEDYSLKQTKNLLKKLEGLE